MKPVRKVKLAVSSIRANAGTQSRAAISEATVAEYAEAMIRGDRFTQQLCALEASLKGALKRFPTKRAMFLALIRKVRADLSLLEREIAAPR
jgi:hypothetical protein